MTTPAPNLQLCFYDHLITLTRYQGQKISTYPISGHDIATALSKLPLASGSGLLPPNTLAWSRSRGQEQLVIYMPARRYQVTVQRAGKTHTYHIPFPAAIFSGHRHSYSIWAVKKRPSTLDAPLYHFPSPNVYSSGSICSGNVPFPTCSCQTIQTAFNQFISSQFNGHLSGGKAKSHTHILDLWQLLNGRSRFPLAQLLPANQALSSMITRT